MSDHLPHDKPVTEAVTVQVEATIPLVQYGNVKISITASGASAPSLINQCRAEISATAESMLQAWINTTNANPPNNSPLWHWWSVFDTARAAEWRAEYMQEDKTNADL